MTATAIEAKSLSSLTSLAANPPSIPQNVYLDPLVLYIARVPGSRDVFLSPLKPRQKVVTAEDVASSLYYLHVSNPEDENLLLESKAIDHEDEIASSVEEDAPPLPVRQPPPPPPPQHSIGLPDALRPGAGRLNNHPLPPLPSYPVEDGPPHFSSHPAVERRPVNSIARKPAPSMPQRKPVNEQPKEPEPPLPELPTRNPAHGSINDEGPQRPYLAQRPTMSTTAGHSSGTPEVTVIRRNPASGEQWNVASIRDPPVFDIASDGRRGSMTSTKIRKSGQPLYLSINHPGYHKFLRADAHSRNASVAGSTPSLAFSDGPTEHSETEPCFTRRMWLEGSLFEKQSHSHRKSLSADQADSRRLSPRPTFNSRNTSGLAILPSSMQVRDDSSNILDPHDMRRLSLAGDQKRSNTKGYTFLSPWDGRCEFVSGTMGNSLKCRQLRMKNSLAPDSNVPEQVSELRFNLPGGGPMASEPRRRSPTKPGQKESKRSRLLAKFSDRGSSYDDAPYDEALDDRLDLSLGQELAGGGFAGKQAKLGKLIIEGEGLQMLDLIVAANMALWFRAYEKYQEGGRK